VLFSVQDDTLKVIAISKKKTVPEQILLEQILPEQILPEQILLEPAGKPKVEKL